MSNTSARTPAYFLSIGGPNFMEAKDHPAYHKLREVGQEITKKVQPTAVVVFSAHWQAGPQTIEINFAEHTDLIYDFYGFPPHYYEYQYPHRGSPEIAQKVSDKLEGAGVQVSKVSRGLDHGVWVGFSAAFDPVDNPLNVPIVQVSLYGNDDTAQHYRLGQALDSLRDERILIIGAGMAVHNLNDFRAARARGMSVTTSYASTFDEALAASVTKIQKDRQDDLGVLLKSAHAAQAHPTLEHILPICVVAGAASQDPGTRLWTYPEGSLNWAQYRFGDIPRD